MCPVGVTVRCREGKCSIILRLNPNLLVGLFLKCDFHKGFFVSSPLLRLAWKTRVDWNPQGSALSPSWIRLWKVSFLLECRHLLWRTLQAHFTKVPFFSHWQNQEGDLPWFFTKKIQNSSWRQNPRKNRDSLRVPGVSDSQANPYSQLLSIHHNYQLIATCLWVPLLLQVKRS